MKKLWVCLVVCFLAAPLLASTSQVLMNLQTAYNGESNAQARYLAFAERADKEGYGPVASLFRAAARAEEVHAANHAAVIRKLGGKPVAKIDKTIVRSTRDNLATAIQGESYERDVMYPNFLKQARTVGNNDAIQAFNLSKNAEAIHTRLFTDAQTNLNQLRGKGVTYYVCTVCGFTTMKVTFEKCPACASSKEKFVAVS